MKRLLTLFLLLFVACVDENGQKTVEKIYKDGEIVKVIGMWNEDGSVKE